MTELVEYAVSIEHLPEMDMSINCGKGYDALNELMRAIILRAIEDYNSSGIFREEAIMYMCDDGDEGEEDELEDYIFSFKSICRHLGMDPEKTRYAIMNASHRISTRRRAA